MAVGSSVLASRLPSMLQPKFPDASTIRARHVQSGPATPSTAAETTPDQPVIIPRQSGLVSLA